MLKRWPTSDASCLERRSSRSPRSCCASPRGSECRYSPRRTSLSCTTPSSTRSSSWRSGTGTTRQGKRVERVRVVTEPHSDYIRWEIAGTPYNLAAGEDIRYLPRGRAEQVGLPDHDFCLFDSTRLVLLHFDEDDQPLQHELTTDPAVVVRHCCWRDVAWHYALPYSQYTAR